jgi:hypothetical protein
MGTSSLTNLLLRWAHASWRCVCPSGTGILLAASAVLGVQRWSSPYLLGSPGYQFQTSTIHCSGLGLLNSPVSCRAKAALNIQQAAIRFLEKHGYKHSRGPVIKFGPAGELDKSAQQILEQTHGSFRCIFKDIHDLPEQDYAPCAVHDDLCEVVLQKSGFVISVDPTGWVLSRFHKT